MSVSVAHCDFPGPAEPGNLGDSRANLRAFKNFFFCEARVLWLNYYFSLALQRNSVLVLLVVQVSTSRTIRHTHTHTHTHTHSLGKTPLNSEQPVAVAATYTTSTRDEHLMQSAEFEPAIAEIRQLQAYASDRTATAIGLIKLQF